MKKIAHVYSGKINAQNGVASVLKSFSSFDWKRHKVDVSFFALDEVDYDGNPLSNSLAKRIYKNSANSQWIIYDLAIILKHLLNALIVLFKFNRKSKGECSIIFHDIWVLIVFELFGRKVGFSSRSLVLHNDGDIEATFYSVFPRFTKSFAFNFFKKILNNCFKPDLNIIFLSEKAKDVFGKNFPLVRSNLLVISNGLEKSEKNRDVAIAKSNDEIVFHCTGTVCSRKRQYFLLKIISKIRINKKITLNFWGDGPDLPKMKSVVFSNDGLKVNFHGRVARPYDYYNKGDCFILISENEGFSIAVLEAMRAGCLLLLTDTGGNKEIINKSYGFIFENDENNISENLKNFIFEISNFSDEDIEKYSNLNIDSFNENFCIEKVIEKYSSI